MSGSSDARPNYEMKERNCSTVFKSLIVSEYFLQKEEEQNVAKKLMHEEFGALRLWQQSDASFSSSGLQPGKNGSGASQKLHGNETPALWRNGRNAMLVGT